MENKNKTQALQGLLDAGLHKDKQEIQQAEKIWESYVQSVIPINKRRIFFGEEDLAIIREAIKKYSEIDSVQKVKFIGVLKTLVFLFKKEQADLLIDFVLETIQSSAGNVRQAVIYFAGDLRIVMNNSFYGEELSDTLVSFLRRLKDLLNTYKPNDVVLPKQTQWEVITGDNPFVSDLEYTYFEDLKPSVYKSLVLLWERVADYEHIQERIHATHPELKVIVPQRDYHNNWDEDEFDDDFVDGDFGASMNPLWGEDTPYSQVSMREEVRILGDSISRVFLVVEAHINPFTFDYVLRYSKDVFKDDMEIQQLLKTALFKGPQDGYIACAGEEEFVDEESFKIALEYKDRTIKTVLRMHEFVIKELGLHSTKTEGVDGRFANDIGLENIPDQKYVWDDQINKVISVDDSVFEDGTMIKSPAGSMEEKIRYYIVFVTEYPILNREDTKIFARTLSQVARDMNIDIEMISGERSYILCTVLVPTDVVLLDFITKNIELTNQDGHILRKDHIVTNVARPTGNEILTFLQRLK